MKIIQTFIAFLEWCEKHEGLIEAGATLGVFVFTIILAISTILLWIETKRAGETAEKTADAALKSAKATEIQVSTSKAALRAHILVERAELIITPNNTVDIRVFIKNFGQTPSSISSWINAEYAVYPLDIMLPSGERIVGKPIGPGATQTLKCGFDSISGSLINSILGETAAIYVYGEVNYFDIFQDWHTTKFNLVCVGKAIHTKYLEFYEEGNYAD